MGADRIGLITRVERRRRWSVEDKLGLVAETWEDGKSVALVAKTNGISPSLLYSWRRQASRGELVAPRDCAAPAFVAYEFYAYAAESEWLSERATSRFEAQVEDAEVPLVIAGRSEALVYFEAILDSVLIGHGSWPENSYYAEKLVDERYEHGLSTNRAKPKDASVPIHSHFFGGWIEAGLVGGIYWAYIVVLIVKSLLRSSFGISHMRPLYLYGAVLLLWDVFFSPFSGFRRLETAFLIVIVLRSLLQRGTRSTNISKPRRSRSQLSKFSARVHEGTMRKRRVHRIRRRFDSLPSRTDV